MSGYYSVDELKELGLREFGKNVLISRKASICNPANLSVGDNVRIDDFVLITGSVWLHSYIHIGSFCSLGGRAGIIMHDFSGLSAGTKVFSMSDDYSGEYMANSAVPERYRKVSGGTIYFERHALVGANSVVLPGVTISEGAAVGAMSLVTKTVPPFWLYAGIPAKPIRERKRNLLALEEKLRRECQ